MAGIMGSPVASGQAGGLAHRQCLVLCPEHISMVMKFSGWIDLMKWECSSHEP